VRAELARLDVTPVEDPLTELQKLAGEVLAWKNALAARLNELTSVRYETQFGEELRSEVALFKRAMDRCERVLVAMAKLNLDARLVRLSEEQGSLVSEVLRLVLAELGIDPEAVRPVVARNPRVVADRQRRALAPAS
jgi:hypothetical protein